MAFTEYNQAGRERPIDFRFREGEGVAGLVMVTGQPYLSNDAAGDAQVIPEVCKALGYSNLVNVPILDRAGTLLGCFELHNKEGGFSDQDLLVLQSLSATAAIAMENARLFNERTQAEEEIRQREHLLSQSQKVGHIGSWAWDLRGPIKWTDETYRIYGRSPDNFTPSVESLINLLHPDDRPAMQQWIEACAAGNSPGELEFRTVLPDGSVRFLSGRGELIRNDNGPDYLAGTVQDITHRKQTEAAEREARRLLRAVLDTVPVRVFWKDRESRFLGCNLPFANDAGLRRPQEIIGKTDLDLSWREQAEAYRADDRRVMETGTPKVGYEEPQPTPEGTQIWLRTSKIPLRDGDGQIVGVLGTYEDITASKQAREALQRSEALLRKSQALGHIGSWELNLVTNQLTWSDEVFGIFGVTPQKFAATYEGFLDLVHPDDRRSLDAAYSVFPAGATRHLCHRTPHHPEGYR